MICFRQCVLKQLPPTIGPDVLETFAGPDFSRLRNGTEAKETVTTSAFGVINFSTKFKLRPKMVSVLNTLPDFPRDRSIYTYREVTNLLSQYILSNKQRLIDDRNIRAVNCEGDPLGEAFGVRAFHRTQVSTLLRRQLIRPEVKRQPNS